MTDLSQLPGANQILTKHHLDENPLKLRILTFNLATNVQLNEINGSEAITVEKCQSVYPTQKGWSVYPNLSQCTLNASNFIILQQCDLLGFQECVEPSFSTFLRWICQGTGRNYQMIGSGSVQFIYDQNKLGQGILLSKPNLCIIEETRLMIVVWFPQTKLLAVNLHAPHDFDLQKHITETFNSIDIPSTVKPDRIIMTGDFNDSYRSPLKEITFLNMKLRQHHIINETSLQTCCADSNYRWIGDYIFDTEYTRDGYYGISVDADKSLMSDHHPVIYTEYTT